MAEPGGLAEPGAVAELRRLMQPDSVTEPADAAALETRLRRSRRPGLVTVPEQLRLGRVAVSTSAVVALVALVVALGCAFVLRVLWAEREAVAEPAGVRSTASSTGVAVTRTGPGEGPASPGGTGGAKVGATPAAGASTTGGGASQVVVHVVGQVNRPGLVRLAAGARVADAVSAAGGASKHADLAALNLARPVIDGEQVYVPRPGETPPPPPAPPGGGSAGGGSGGGGSGGGGSGGVSGSGSGPVNLNTADLGALDSLPGVGPVLAQRILDWRTEHGRFSSIEELSEVSGIGDKLLAQLKPKVTL